MKKFSQGTGIAVGIGTGILFYMLLPDFRWAAAIGGGVALALELIMTTRKH